MNAEISETIRARLLGFSMQIPEIPAHRKFVSSVCHAHFYAHKPPTNFKKSWVWTRISWKLSKIENCDFKFKFLSLVRRASLLREYATPTLARRNRIKKYFSWNVLVPSIPIDFSTLTLKSVYHTHNHIFRSRVGGAFQSRFAAYIYPFPFCPFSWVMGIW